MRRLAFMLVVSAVSVCLGLAVHRAKSVRPVPSESDERGGVAADLDDSDLFFQTAIRAAGPPRDNSQKIDALLKRMALEEKVGQMTQLAIGMISNGRDQTIQIDPAKLDKAIVRNGVGSILNGSEQALIADPPTERIGQ